MTDGDIVGTWRLVSWENRKADGSVNYPFGKDAKGYILYTNDGYMSATLAHADRGESISADILRWNKDEQSRAAETYISYCGRYEFLGDRVIHHVDQSLFPGWIGSDQERLVAFDGKHMTLRSRPMLFDGEQQTAYVVWERA